MNEAHLGSQGDICFFEGKLISVAEDGIMKVYKGSEMQTQIELTNGETHSICTNQVDKVILGGSKKTCDIFSVSGEIKSSD